MNNLSIEELRKKIEAMKANGTLPLDNAKLNSNSQFFPLIMKLRQTERQIVSYADGEISHEEYCAVVEQRRELKKQLEALKAANSARTSNEQ